MWPQRGRLLHEAREPQRRSIRPGAHTQMPRSLLRFCESYQPAEAHVVNLALKKTIKAGQPRIYLMSYGELMGESF
jgi:hypothetical protein